MPLHHRHRNHPKPPPRRAGFTPAFIFIFTLPSRNNI